MGLPRFATFAISIGLMIPSAQATTEPFIPPPPHSLDDSHTLNLQAAGSRLLADAIEDALRQGGTALFDEGFQLDSSLNWVFGKSIEGQLDVVVPLWSSGEARRALFLQPGAAFWPGLEEQDRTDVNLGLVYRSNLVSDTVGGVSFFYDYSLERGHDRVGGGLDVQHDVFYAGLNYYHPLDEWLEGRTDYEEQALQGADIRFGLAMDWARFGGSFGAWRFEGEEDAKTQWRRSLGLEAGFRIVSGVSLEAGYERRDEEDSLGSRWNAGLAFRFDLPGLKGSSHGNARHGKPDLWQVVEREKRILYEERIAGPSVSIAQAEGQGANLREDNDNHASIQIRLKEALEEDVVLNLVGSGTATYGASADYQVSVGNEACDAVTMANCQVTIPMGSTVADVMITAREDGGGEPAETIVLSIAIASAGDTGLTLGNPSSLLLTIDADPTAGFVLSSSTVREPATGTLEHRIAVSLSASPAAIVVLDADFDTEDSSSEIVDDYNSNDQQRRVTFAAGATGDDLVQEVILIINADDEVEDDETIVLTLADSNDSLASNGNNFTLENTRHIVAIPANDEPEEPATTLPTISFDAATKTAIEGDDATNAQTTATLSITPPPTSDVVIPYTVGGDGVENTDYLISFRATSGAASVNADGLIYPANATGVVFTITARDDTDRMDETVAITINDAAANFPAGYDIGDHRMVAITLEDTTLLGMTLGFELSEVSTPEIMGVVHLRAELKDASGMRMTTLGVNLPFSLSVTNNDDDDIRVPSGAFELDAQAATFSRDGFVFPFIVVTINDDAIAEDDETFTITLNEGANFPDGWSIDSSRNKSVELTITGNDNTVSFASSSADSVIENATSGSITIDLTSPAPAGGLPILIATEVGGLATTDYTITPVSPATYVERNLIIPAGEMSGSFTLTAPADTGGSMLRMTLVEGSTVTPASSWTSSWGSIPERTITRTININEHPGGTLGFELSEVSTPETITGLNIVNLRGELKDPSGARITNLPVNLPFTLSVANNDDNDIRGLPSGELELDAQAATFSRDGFVSPFVVVTINDDDMAEGDETFTITLSEGANFPDGWSIDSNKNSIELTILANDQSARPTVSLVYNGNLTVSESVSSVPMTIQLSEALGENVVFNLTLGSSSTATLGVSGDFVVQYNNLSGTAVQCDSTLAQDPQTIAIRGRGACEPTISAGLTSLEIRIIPLDDDLSVHTDTNPEDINLSISIPSTSASLVGLGSPSSQTITIQ